MGKTFVHNLGNQGEISKTAFQSKGYKAELE